MFLGIFALGVFLILAGLWNRDRERLAIGLFILGGVLVVVGGILALPELMDPAP